MEQKKQKDDPSEELEPNLDEQKKKAPEEEEETKPFDPRDYGGDRFGGSKSIKPDDDGRW